VRGNRPTEVAGEHNRAEYGRLRDDIERQAYELDEADAEDDARGISELGGPLNGHWELEQLDDAIEQQEEDRECAQDAPDPDGL
jgi:hypothetical protein